MFLSVKAVLAGICLLLIAPAAQAQQSKKKEPQPPPKAQAQQAEKAKQDQALKARLQSLIACENKEHKFPPEQQITACTAIIQTRGEIPRNVVLALYSRGNTHARIGKDDQAIEDFTLAIRHDPKYAAAYNNRGNAYGRKGQVDRALADHNEAVRLVPKSALALKNRATDFQTKGQYDRALKDYSQAIRLDAKFAAAFNGRCAMRGIIGRELNEALTDCDAALRLNPDDDLRASIFENRGLVYVKREEFYPALTDYNASLEMNPKSAFALYGRGYVKLKKGDASGETDIAAAKAIQPKIAEDYAKYGLK